MKILALFLYGTAFFISLAAGSLEGTLIVIAQTGAGITVFLGLVAVFDILFSGIKKARTNAREEREHREWIL